MFDFDNDFILFYGILIMHSNITQTDLIYIEDLNSSINDWILSYLSNNNIRFKKVENDEESKIVIYYEDFTPSKKHLIYWLISNKNSIIHPLLFKLSLIEFKFLITGMILGNINNFDKYSKQIYFYLNHFNSSSSYDLYELFKQYKLPFYNVNFNYFMLYIKDIKSFDNNDNIIQTYIE